jgi:hypothetical protein
MRTTQNNNLTIESLRRARELINNATTLKDSGGRRAFATGSVRDLSKGKGRFDLLPYEAIFAYAFQLELGAVKYSARNWEKGQPISVFLDSGLRHLFRYLNGDRDEDHLRAGFWNIGAAITMRERIKAGKLPKELWDLPGEL